MGDYIVVKIYRCSFLSNFIGQVINRLAVGESEVAGGELNLDGCSGCNKCIFAYADCACAADCNLCGNGYGLGRFYDVGKGCVACSATETD